MSPTRIIVVVLGALGLIVGVGTGIGGSALLWAHGTQRDAAGYYSTSAERFQTPAYALSSSEIDLEAEAGDEWLPLDIASPTARVQATSTTGAPVFVGIGRRDDVDAYLAGSAHDRATDVEFGPFRVRYERSPGEQPPALPGSQEFWVAWASGPGQQTVTWPLEHGRWAVVVMNADSSPGVSVDVSVGAKTGVLLPIGLSLLAFALVSLAVGAGLVFAGLNRTDRSRANTGPVPDAVGVSPAGVPGSYPLRIWGHLDEPLNRGLWLIKWFLAIPHFIVLALLWMALAVLTVVAGVAILFTARYPRSIFEFNVGVLRWTWRTSFYAIALGTDRYPPFTLQSDPSYPADLAVDYPAQLSRPLVLVKWWLLALLHYLVVAVFGGGMTWWVWNTSGNERAIFGGGLISLLALIAGVVLLFTKRYPQPIFDFVMGMNRWTYRVWAYAGLFRDEYPPFRLDNGGPDPGSQPSPPPPSPDRSGELVG